MRTGSWECAGRLRAAGLLNGLSLVELLSDPKGVGNLSEDILYEEVSLWNIA
jgi:hypothetical protein